jgi:hypothetical protein
VIDPRVGKEKASIPITAWLPNVPLETAVHLLADMGGLSVVRMDNVFYVTTPENAAKWKLRFKRTPPLKSPVPKAQEKMKP